MNNFRSIIRESVLLKQCDHPNVLTVLGVVLNTDHDCGLPFIVLPYMANGDLKGYLKNKRLDYTATEQLPLVSCNDAVAVSLVGIAQHTVCV